MKQLALIEREREYPPTRIRSYDPLEIAWAAGFLDGEGHFGATARAATIEAAQVATDAPLRRLLRLFGGSVTKRGGSHPAHVWKMSSPASIRPALLLLIPHLLVKREQAEILLRFACLFTGRQGVAPDPVAIHLRNHLAERLLGERKGL